MGAGLTFLRQTCSLLAVLLCFACADATRPSAAEQTPSRQFILRQVRFEERRDGRVVWRGTGTRADGDLDVSDISDLLLIRPPQTATETEFTVAAPHGHVAFDRGQATFEEVRVTDPNGSLLTASAARYDEGQGTLVADGPLHFSTPSLVVLADSATLWLQAGSVEVRGPVEGQMHSLAAARASHTTPAQL